MVKKQLIEIHDYSVLHKSGGEEFMLGMAGKHHKPNHQRNGITSGSLT